MYKPAKHIAFTIILSLFSMLALAQNSLDTSAEKLYRTHNFSEALPLYQTLVQKNRVSSTYNHRLGVCLLKTNGSLADAEKHLKYAKNKGIRYAHFFLGQVYKKQYKFEEAIASYNTYLRGIRSDNENYLFVKNELESCEKLETYLLRTEEIEIINTKIVSTKNFHKHYNLSKESGKVLLSSSLFENTDTNFVMYMNELEDRICYPRIIGDTLDTDLFAKSRLLDKWGAEERLSSIVNSEGNELYPYILDDGLTLYFSSNGHGGLGGYDIFVTRYNPQTNTYLAPTNLGMPYNSTGDDFLFVADEFSNTSWFASNRNNKDDEITIYSFTPNTFKKSTSLKGADLRAAAQLLTKPDSLSTINMSDSVQQKNILPSFKEEDRSIYFVVNDTLIYKSTLQFRSASALHLFKQGEQNILFMDQQKKNIAQKREDFSKLKTQSEREIASQEILKTETNIYELESSLETPFQQAQNKEMEIVQQYHYPLFSVDDYRLNTVYTETIDTPVFILPTVQSNYKIIFLKEEIEQFTTIEQTLKTEYKAVNILSTAPEILHTKENSTTLFWRSLRTIDTTFQYTNNVQITENAVTKTLQQNYKFILHHLFVKVDLLENKSQSLSLFIRGQKFKDEMQALLIKAEKEKNESMQQLIAANDTTLSKKEFDSISERILSCQEIFEFSLVYYIEDYGGSLSLASSHSLSDTAYIDSLQQQLPDTTTVPLAAPKPIQPATKPLMYKVQLGVFSKKLPEDLLDKLPEITILPMEQSHLRKYFAGNYTTHDEAKQAAKSFEKYGFKGAFVVPFIHENLADWDEVKTFNTSQ